MIVLVKRIVKALEEFCGFGLKYTDNLSSGHMEKLVGDRVHNYGYLSIHDH